MAKAASASLLPSPLPQRITIRAKPNARETMITAYDEQERVLHVDIAAQPEDNKANIALLKFLKRITKKSVRLVTGATSKDKVIEFSE